MGGVRRANNNPWRKLQLLLLCFTLLHTLILAKDTIMANTPLSGDQTIVSANQTFELGFYQPDTSTSNYYIAMWYKKITKQTPVWVANRDHPVSNKHSSHLKILNGNLVITTGSNSTLIWSTNLTSSTTSIQAILLDNGNLILIDTSSKPKTTTNYLWQSFEHPAHTWLPGSKLGLNKETNKTQYLTSWKNSNNPATGLFSLELDPNRTSQYLIIWNNTERYWTSGPWDDQHKIFSLVPEMRLNYIYNFSYVDNVNESYFIYSVYDPSYISRFVIDVSGQIKQYTWLDDSQQWNLFWSQPRQQCEVYAFCGAYGTCNQISPPFCNCLQGFQPKSNSDWQLNDHSSGCGRKTQLNCRTNGTNSKKKPDQFWVYPNMQLPDNPITAEAASISSSECESTCLKNCSCTAYAYSNNACLIWYGDLLNVKQLSSDDAGGKILYLRLAASEFPPKTNRKLHIGIIIGSIAGAFALIFLALFIYCGKIRQRSVSATKTMEGTLVAFTFKELQTATKNFSEKLGGGGFGSVFKGTLPDSSLIAVKKLESISQGEKQFRTEVSTIGTIQHVNLVRLRGFCSEGANKLLVYDFMPNSSLDTVLFHEKKKVGEEVLDWNTRFQVAVGTARGLTYLHEKCRDCIIHCDIKPENILLDGEFCPKVADFGLAKLVGRDFSRVLTTMRGTRGYLAPEWISGVAITAKADVYSYGMMIFELVSGRRNTEQSEDGKIKFFPTWAASRITEGEGDILSIVDPRLEGKADSEEVMKICKLGCWCIQDDENRRPTMGQVVQILEGVLDVNMPPMPRSLQVFAENQEQVIFFTDSSSVKSSSQTRTNTSGTTSLTSQTKSNVSAVSNKSEE